MSAAYRFARLAAACAAILWQVPPAQAATYYWTLSPPQTGNWSDPNNWGGTAPVAGDNAIIDNGGTANVTAAGAACYSLSLGDSVGGSGAVQMTGGTMSGSVQYVGNAGTGTFTQSGGSNGGSSSLFLGYNSTGNGTYQLSGPAALSTNSQFVGYYGTGILSQLAGTNTVSSYGYLYLGYQPGSSGTYQLSSTGQLSAPAEYVGYDPAATGLFQQTGGSNTTSYVAIGSGGHYVLGGGTLDITGNYGGISNQGTIDCSNSQATLLAGSDSFIDLSQANLSNVSGMTVNIGANSLVTVPAGFNPYTAFGSFKIDPSSILHTANSPLVVAAGQTIGGQGAINDHVSCAGTINTGGGAINFNNGLSISGAGFVNLGNQGSVTVNDNTSGITGGTLEYGSGVYVGRGGTGVFTQSGGQYYSNGSLTLGWNAGDSGTYVLSGGTAEPVAVNVGYAGTGDFQQSGGSVSASSAVTLGGNSGSNGTYELSGAASSLSTQHETIGVSGSGTFTQSGGTHSVSGAGILVLGYNSASSGTYQLNGGQLTVNNLYAGQSGVGVFNQSGGTNTVGTALYLGCTTGGTGTYSLGGGQLSAPNEYLGGSPNSSALFQQSGGTNSAAYLVSIASNACYQLSGGTLQVSGGIINAGVFDGGNSPGTLAANCLVDLTSGTWQNLRSTTAVMGSDSLLIVPAGVDPSTVFAANSTFSLVHAAGSTLVVPAGRGFVGSGTINDLVSCQGTINAGLYGAINLTGGLMLSGNCSLSLGGGNSTSFGRGSVTINNATSNMTGGTLAVFNEYVGMGGTGVFTQSGGTNTNLPPNNSGYTGYLYLGYNAGDSGTYNLGGTGVISAMNTEYVGYSGSGNFAQSGGGHTVGILYVGYNSGSQGAFSFGGGATMYAVNQYVGYNGQGVFAQTGGTNGSAQTGWSSPLYLGYQTSGNGAYQLSQTGQLYATAEYVGYSGTGALQQSGGSNVLTNLGGSPYQYGTIYLGYNAGSNANYLLSGTGQVSAHYEYIGCNTGATALFQQTGGTNTATSLALGNGGTYSLDGGTLIVPSLSGSGAADFTFGGGTLQASGALSTALPMTLSGTGGNANVNTNGNAVTLSGQLSGVGGLDKLGANTLTLAAQNTYLGPTTISAGTLTLGNAGSLSSSSIDVGAGATYDVSAVNGGYYLDDGQTLSGTGTVKGDTTVSAGAILSPGDVPGAVGTLSFNASLLLDAGTILDFDLAGPSASDLISLPSSTLTLDGQQFSDFDFNAESGFKQGSYTLIGANLIQGSLGSDLTGMIGNYPASLSISGGDLVLTVAAPEPSTVTLLLAAAACVLGFSGVALGRRPTAGR